MPLYGSGLRCLRMSAATSPTRCLDGPLTTIRVGCGTSNSIPSGAFDRNRVRVAQGEFQIAAAQLRAVADALDLKPLLEAIGDALDHVRDERSGQPVERTVLTPVRRARDDDSVVDLLDLDVAVDVLEQLPLGAVDGHALRLDRDGDAGGHWNWLLSDTGHD